MSHGLPRGGPTGNGTQGTVKTVMRMPPTRYYGFDSSRNSYSDYARPPVDTPANWLEAQDPRLKMTPAEQRDWWKVFKDSTLDKLINAAYQQNLPWQVAGVWMLEARAHLGVANGERYSHLRSIWRRRRCTSVGRASS